MEALGTFRCPIPITAGMTTQTGIIKSDKVLGKCGLLAILFNRLKHIGFRIGVDFEDVCTNITNITRYADRRLTRFWHVALNTTRTLLAMDIFGVTSSNFTMAFSTIVFGINGPVVRIVALGTRQVFMNTGLQLVDLLMVFDETVTRRR